MTPYILNIHTATETAIINITKGSDPISTRRNTDTKHHAAFLHQAISEMMEEEGISPKELSAIGVTSGPGSYTGMRVGLAAAKGFCYALKIPLISLNTLQLMAASAAAVVQDHHALYSPMIDARRMEVYTALYTFDLAEISAPSAKIISETTYLDYPENQRIVVSGSGSSKLQEINRSPIFDFVNIDIESEKIAEISWGKFQHADFEIVPYAQPLYIKEFYTTSTKRNL